MSYGYNGGRQQADGTYQRGHTKQLSSFSGGSWSSVPPLSLQETAIVHLKFAQQGLLDALKFQVAIEKLIMDKVVQGNVLKSSLLQGIVLVSALAIKPLLSRATHDEYSSARTTTSILSVLFHILWLYPLAAAATYYSGLLRPSQETDRRSAGRQGGDYRGMTAQVVGESYRALVTVNYFLVILFLRFIPFFGAPIAFLYACVVDSYYCFEQHWVRQSWPFAERVKHLDSRWSYFIGFGFPITFISWWSSDPIVNLALFALFYPFFQIMSQTTMPQPLDPTLPSSAMAISFQPGQLGKSSFSMAAAEGGEEARGRRGSPLIPIRIQVLFPADKVYALLSKTFVGKKKDAGAPSNSAYGAGYDAAGAGGWRGDYGGAAPAAASPARSYGHGGNAPTPPRRGHVMTESSVGVGAGDPIGQPQFGGAAPGYGGGAPGYGAPPAGYGGASAGGYADKNLDSLIRLAAGRKKGD